MTDSRPCASSDPLAHRLVGDPVDVVTGGNVDRHLDFRLTGPIPLEWYRHYDSALAHRRFGLGWGHAHHFERTLLLDVDGVRYVGPLGRGAGFPWLERDGAEVTSGPFVLRRVDERTRRVRERGLPTMEFVFAPQQIAAPLARLVYGAHAIVFDYDEFGRLRTIVDAAGRVLQVRTDAEGRVLGIAQAMPEGEAPRHVLSYEFDAVGNLVRGVDAHRSAFGFRWDRAHRMVERTDRSGYAFHFEYDADGRCVRSRGADGLHEVRLRYLAAERTTIVTRADGGEWQYFHDEQGALVLVVDPYGGQRSFVIGPDGMVAEESDPNGDVTTFVNGSGGPVAKVDVFGTITPLPEDPNAIDPQAHRIARNAAEYEYGWLLAQGEALEGPAPSRWHELPAELRRAVGDPPPAAPPTVPAYEVTPLAVRWWPRPASGRTFDDFAHLVRQRDGEGRSRRWLYDAAGNVRQYVDFDGARWTEDVASWNLLTRTVDPLGNETRYRWTATEQLAQVVDPGGTSTEFDWDLKDRLVEVRRHGALKERYTYDAADHVVAKLDPDGVPLIKFTRGPGGRAVKKVLASGEVLEYEYDARGRYAAHAAAGERTELAYDALGHRVAELRDGLGVEHRYAALEEPVETRVLGFAIRYGWAGGARTITDPTGATTRIAALGDGLLWRRTPTGADEVVHYDEMGRCTRKVVQRRRSAHAQWVRRFVYSGEGDLLRVEDSVEGASEYRYDAAHRLVGARSRHGEARYEYDAAGNLLAQPGLAGVTLQPGNRLATANGDRFEYDRRNRLAVRRGARGETHYRYDARDQLRAVEGPAGQWSATYDALGRRTRVAPGERGSSIYWDGDRIAGELRDDGSVRVYVYAAPLALTPIAFVEYDALDAPPASGRRYVVYANQIGAPVLVEDADGRVAWQARLDPYGRAHVEPGATIDMPLRWPGHHHDDATGLHYNRFRHYSPELGRYLESDPVGIPGGVNLYAYTANPLATVDVRGEACAECDRRVAQARQDRADIEEGRAPRSADPEDTRARQRLARAAGMEDQQLRTMQQLSRDTGTVHVLRDTNPITPHRVQQQRAGQLRARPKGHDVLLKSDKETGLVTRRANDFDAQEARARTPAEREQIAAMRQHEQDLLNNGWRYDDNGVLRDPNGDARYGDHDLQGVYRENPPGSRNWESPMGTTRTTDHDAPPEDGPYLQRLNDATGPPDMYQHGPNDNYRNADGTGPGRNPGRDEQFTVIDENGRATRMNVDELKDYYDQRGMPWPYDVPPYPPE